MSEKTKQCCICETHFPHDEDLPDHCHLVNSDVVVSDNVAYTSNFLHKNSECGECFTLYFTKKRIRGHRLKTWDPICDLCMIRIARDGLLNPKALAADLVAIDEDAHVEEIKQNIINEKRKRQSEVDRLADLGKRIEQAIDNDATMIELISHAKAMHCKVLRWNKNDLPSTLDALRDERFPYFELIFEAPSTRDKYIPTKYGSFVLHYN